MKHCGRLGAEFLVPWIRVRAQGKLAWAPSLCELGTATP